MGRDTGKCTASIAKISQINPMAKISFERINLADASSISDFTQRMMTKGQL